MENIISSMDVNDYDKFKELISASKDSKKFYKIIKILDKQLQKHNISEEKYINYLNILIENGYDISKKNNIKMMLRYKEKDFFRIYKYTLICYVKTRIGMNILEKILILKQIKRFIKVETLEDIITRKEDLYRLIKFLSSFKNKFSKKKVDELDININNMNGLDYQKEELMNRLKLLVKEIGIKFLMNINIPIKTDIEVSDYNNKLMILYYDEVINKITYFMEELWSEITNYIELLNVYVRIKSGKNTLINVSKYENLVY